MSGEQIVNRIFEAVIFDVDQTLVDSAKALAKAWGTWLAEVGVAPDPSRSFHGWTSEDMHTILQWGQAAASYDWTFKAMPTA